MDFPPPPPPPSSLRSSRGVVLVSLHEKTCVIRKMDLIPAGMRLPTAPDPRKWDSFLTTDPGQCKESLLVSQAS